MGRRRVRLQDIANRANVSTATVSLVLNDKAHKGNVHISEQTIQDVKRISLEMGYWTPGRTTVVGLIVPCILPSVQIPLIAGISEVFGGENYSLAMGDLTDEQVPIELAEISTMDRKGFDGLIMEPSLAFMEHPGRFQVLFDKWERLVLVNKGVYAGFACVTTHQQQCGYLAAQHLLERGHRRIAFVGPKYPLNGEAPRSPVVLPTLYDRFQGYCKAMRKYGLAPFSVERAEDILKVPERVTAVYCCRTHEATEFLGLCWDRGVQVPGDLAIVAQGDEREKAIVRPRLTAIDILPREMGVRSARMILDLIHGKEVESVVLEPKLVVRDST